MWKPSWGGMGRMWTCSSGSVGRSGSSTVDNKYWMADKAVVLVSGWTGGIATGKDLMLLM